MPTAVFLCPVNDAMEPIIPPLYAQGSGAMGDDPWGGVKLFYTDEDGHARGAFSIGVMFGERRYVTIDTSPETIAALEADERFERVS